MKMEKVVVIDNYDSFVYNLAQYIGELGWEPVVHRNNAITLDEIARMAPSHIVISPGPGTPDDAGISVEIMRRATVPVLGVCLGHQCIVEVFGGKIVHAREIMHGKTSMVVHTNRGVFHGLPCPFEATRYHSLVIEKESLPECLEITAWTETEDGDIDESMGVRHKEYAIERVQFHPESIMTVKGKRMLRNFLKMTVGQNSE